MSAGALVAALLASAPGPCAPVAPDATPDAAAAEAYLEVAEAEREAGARQSALFAYREALRRDAGNARARAGLQALCQAPPASPEEALRAGLAHLERDEAAAARAALLQARAAPALAPTADFLLGLLALREGRGREAGARFEAAADAADAALAGRARELMRLARREGRVTLGLRLNADYDSNVGLVPDGAPLPQGGSDGVVGALASVGARPWGARGPFARVTGHYRRHARYFGFDLGGVGAALGWAHAGRARHLSAEYGLELLALGGAPYLQAHRLQLAARLGAGPLSLDASYGARLEGFADPAYAGYEGPRQVARLGGEWRPTEALALQAGWLGGHLAARDAPLSFLEHGPRAALRLRAASRLRLAGAAGYTWRHHTAFDEALGARREDGLLEASASAEVDLSSRWSLTASATWSRATSNVPALAYGRLVGGLGLAWSAGLP